jgi:hypothetical protein
MANVVPIYTGEGFKSEKLLTYLSFGLLVLTIASTIISMRANSLQHAQTKLQMAKEAKREEDLKNNVTT